MEGSQSSKRTATHLPSRNGSPPMRTHARPRIRRSRTALPVTRSAATRRSPTDRSWRWRWGRRRLPRTAAAPRWWSLRGPHRPSVRLWQSIGQRACDRARLPCAATAVAGRSRRRGRTATIVRGQERAKQQWRLRRPRSTAHPSPVGATRRRSPRTSRLTIDLEHDPALVAAEQADELALNLHPARRQDANLVGGVRGLERDRRTAPAEALERRLLLIDERDHDVAGVGALTAADEHQVTVEDAGLYHRVAAHFEGEVLAGRKQIGGNADRVAARLDRLDRRARGDATHDRHRDGTAALVLGRGTHAPEMALDHAWGEAARTAAHAVTDRVGKPHHFDRARPVGEAPDEATLLERSDQAVDARLRSEVQRVLHLVERWGNARLLEALVDEAQQF